jgi:hypothetical protein
MTARDTRLVDNFFELSPLQRWWRRSDTTKHWHGNDKRPNYIILTGGNSKVWRRERNLRLVIYFLSGRISWTECLIEILGILTVASPTSSKHARFELRHVVNSWAVFTLLITTAYSSGLVSHLTCPAFSKPLDSIHALVDADIYWSNKYYPAMENLFDIQVGLSFVYLLQWHNFSRNLISTLTYGPLMKPL